MRAWILYVMGDYVFFAILAQNSACKTEQSFHCTVLILTDHDHDTRLWHKLMRRYVNTNQHPYGINEYRY